MSSFSLKHLGTALLLCLWAALATTTFASSVGEQCYDGPWFILHAWDMTLKSVQQYKFYTRTQIQQRPYQFVKKLGFFRNGGGKKRQRHAYISVFSSDPTRLHMLWINPSNRRQNSLHKGRHMEQHLQDVKSSLHKQEKDSRKCWRTHLMSKARRTTGSLIPSTIPNTYRPYMTKPKVPQQDDPRKVERYLLPHEIPNPRCYHQCMLGIAPLLCVNVKQVVCSLLVCDYF